MASYQQMQSRLFGIPAELRNRIYEHICVASLGHREPTIFRTCRRTRAEGLKFFYATHVFFFPVNRSYMRLWKVTDYNHFLTSIDAAKAAMLERLRFHIIHDEDGRERDGGDEQVYLDVRGDATKAIVTDATFSPANVDAADLKDVEDARSALNETWAKHSTPTKHGMLRTVPALVPAKVKLVTASPMGIIGV